LIELYSLQNRKDRVDVLVDQLLFLKGGKTWNHLLEEGLDGRIAVFHTPPPGILTIIKEALFREARSTSTPESARRPAGASPLPQAETS
jgi:hypothetical protein